MTDADLEQELEELSLLETLDHALNRGLVITGEITISVANVDLLFLGLSLVLGSVETMDQARIGRSQERSASNRPGPPDQRKPSGR